jgi:hypothetical protein
MEQIELYKDFRIRAYEDWSGQWLAESRNRLTPMLSTLPRPPVT